MRAHAHTPAIIKVDAQSCVIAGDSAGEMEVGRVVVVGGGYKLVFTLARSPSALLDLMMMMMRMWKR